MYVYVMCMYYTTKLKNKIKLIGRERVNPRISADWSTTMLIAEFSCTQRVQEVHTKAEVLHLTPGLHS